MLNLILLQFADIVLVPHILAEVSNLAGRIDDPARSEIQATLRTLIETTVELPVQSHLGAQRAEFTKLGLTDAVILHLCSLSMNGISPTLVTVDADLADTAHSLGYSVIDYKQQFQAE